MKTVTNKEFKKFTVLYKYKNNIGITLEYNKLNAEQAIEQAKKDVLQCYGSDLFKDFTFEIK